MDQNRYINAYVDIVIGQLHEMLSSNLQLKTQNKLANEIIQEKDNLIGELQNRINAVQNNDSDVQKAKEQAKHWEDSYHTMLAKTSHMDTLLNQVRDMKTIILEKDNLIGELQNRINAVQNNDSDVQKAKEQAKQWEDSYHTMVNKVAHMETLPNQVKDMKAIIQEKDQIIFKINENIEDLQTPKKVINIKPKKKVEDIKLENSIDDF
jgi:hypothetical protein